MTQTFPQRLGVRKQMTAFLRGHGFKYSDSSMDKHCSPAINTGPPVFAWHGRIPLYDFDVALKWAKSRLSTEPPPRKVAKRGQGQVPEPAS